MGRVEKTLDAMRANPLGWRYDEVARILRAHGFETSSTGGSHRVFKHPCGERVGVLEKGRGTLLRAYVEAAVAAIDRAKRKEQT